MFYLITLIVILVIVALFYVEERDGVVGPAAVVRQVAHWITFGLLAAKDATILGVAATKNSNARYNLTVAQSGQQVDVGIKDAVTEYKTSEVRKTLVGATKELHDDTKDMNARMKEILAM